MAVEEVQISAFKDWRSALETLKEWSERDERKSERVLELGSKLIKQYSSKLGDEVWNVHEQLCIAALDCGDHETAHRSLEVLSKKFPNGLRVKRLKGMSLEASGDYDEALKIYTEVLKDHPANSQVMKRKVAILKAKGDLTEAVKELNNLLGIYMCDPEAWLELAGLYIQQNNYKKAAFCMEELILLNPNHHLYHQMYAEICYTQGTQDSLKIASKHYAMALKLNPDNMRALYGFCLVSSVLNSGKKAKNDPKGYYTQAKQQLLQKYQFDGDQLRLVEKALDSMMSPNR